MTRTIPAADLAGLVGQDLGRSDWHLVDQPMIDGFAALCGDRQWIHVDVGRAAAEIGGTIAHGFLTLSLVSAMAQQIWRVENVASAINYGFDRLRFTAAVPAGARIRLHQRLAAVEAKAGGLLVTTQAAVEVEGAERPALVADWLVLFRLP